MDPHNPINQTLLPGYHFFSAILWGVVTPPKFNIDPEKWLLEDYFPIGKVTFQGQTVKPREGISLNGSPPGYGRPLPPSALSEAKGTGFRSQ